MADNEACDLIELEWNTSKPDLTVTNSTGSAPPGGADLVRRRIENDPSAARPFREPFIGVLLPDELEYYSWQPMSAAEPPVLVIERDYEGTGPNTGPVGTSRAQPVTSRPARCSTWCSTPRSAPRRRRPSFDLNLVTWHQQPPSSRSTASTRSSPTSTTSTATAT